ncbi:DUF2268 domain-containing putative Zn-dependent protease [Cytobacillus sp. FJAT-53684]|uniref:DUF2268 domain-containing putative Zn-dependent protease n=1 Tax=Cytobacillus mangrovibacter TaxID=3299024 RepID=A0ABW6JYY1_9BACI
MKKRLIFIFLIFIIISMITACEAEKNEVRTIPESITDTIENPETGQMYTIVHAYELYDGFLEKRENTPRNEQLDLYKKEIIKPIYDSCFQGAEYLHMVDSLLNELPYNFTELKEIADGISREETNEVIKSALIKSSELLPSEHEQTVCIFPNTKERSSTMIAAGAGKITVLYNRFYTDDVIKAGIAHEYHHSVWTEKHFQKKLNFTVLDNLIFEGKAVFFEKLVYPEITFTQIDPVFYQEHWGEIEMDLDKVDGNRSHQIIMGGGGLPPSYGYSEGYKMVRSYIDLHPEISPLEWTEKSAQEIFTQGKYIQNYR